MLVRIEQFYTNMLRLEHLTEGCLPLFIKLCEFTGDVDVGRCQADEGKDEQYKEGSKFQLNRAGKNVLYERVK